MAIGDEKIGIDGREVNGDVTDTVSAIDEGEYAFFFTDGCERFEGHAETGKGADTVVDGETGILACVSGGLDGCSEGGEEI